MRIIVTGASGLLGREVVRTLSEDHTVEGWGFTRTLGLKRVNLLTPNEAAEACESFKPDVLVHAAAERRPDTMDKRPSESWELNVDVPKRLAETCFRTGTALVFVSTDYVFDGIEPPYDESAKPNPLNLYGKSKAAAEQGISATGCAYTILRVPILYGPSTDAAESAVTVLLRNLTEGVGQDVFLDDGAIRYPTLTSDVARAIRFLVDKRTRGVYHYTAEEPYTKYGMARLMASVLGLSASTIYPDPHPARGTKRPLNSHLNGTKLRRAGFSECTPFGKGIAAVLGRLQ